ncbi:MAG: redoxin domain-containing protein [Novosphingobium sp.]|nr:redoxin domain-containing protein [Novosphingobium sp.]
MSGKKIALYIVGAVVLVFAGMAAWMLGPALLPTKSIDVGIAVGATAPVEMELYDAKGEPTTLAGNMGERGMVLFLVRSADWCPFCQAQLIETNGIHGNINAKGYSLASLSYDKSDLLAKFAANKGINFTMLSDINSAMIDALDVRDPQYGPESSAYGVPRATILVLAPNGRVKAKHVSEDFRSRPSNDDVLAMIAGVAE